MKKLTEMDRNRQKLMEADKNGEKQTGGNGRSPSEKHCNGKRHTDRRIYVEIYGGHSMKMPHT